MSGITFGVGEAKMKSITFTRQVEKGVKWELEVAPTWDINIYNRGFKARAVAGGEVHNIFDKDGVPVTLPQMMKENGTLAVSASDLAILNFPIHPRKPFNVFGWTADAG